jgi:threonine synthase
MIYYKSRNIFITVSFIDLFMNGLFCNKCGKEYPLDSKIWHCVCGGLLDIEFSSTFPIDMIRSRKPTMWRYREAIPISENKNILSFDEGFTPLLEVVFNNKNVLIKQEHLFQTGSYKDRGASVLVSKVKELGVKHIIEDSSGNAGCSIAAYSAAAGISCDIYVPAGTAINKLVQLEYYKANFIKIPGSREDTARAALEAVKESYYASHSWNPFFFHGTKTFAFEVCEQLDWHAPDTVVLPVGNGTLLLGAYIGFNDLLTTGIISEIPKIIGIQAASCAPLVNAYLDELDELPKIPSVEFQTSIAEGITIAEPVRGNQILGVVRESKGGLISVSENEIINALIAVGSKGYYIEPTSAATIAGLLKYIETTDKDEQIVSVFTGHGLKSTQKMLSALNE